MDFNKAMGDIFWEEWESERATEEKSSRECISKDDTKMNDRPCVCGMCGDPHSKERIESERMSTIDDLVSMRASLVSPERHG